MSSLKTVYATATEIILKDFERERSKDGMLKYNHIKFLLLKECDNNSDLRALFIDDNGNFRYRVLGKLLQDLGFRKCGLRKMIRKYNTLPKILR